MNTNRTETTYDRLRSPFVGIMAGLVCLMPVSVGAADDCVFPVVDGGVPLPDCDGRLDAGAATCIGSDAFTVPCEGFVVDCGGCIAVCDVWTWNAMSSASKAP